MTFSDRDNPYARATAWTASKPQPARVEPEPEPVKAEPPVRRNSIYSGSAIPMGPPTAAPAPKPHPEIPPPGEPRPPLRTVHVVAPAPAPRARRPIRRFVPLIGSLATAAAGFALMAFVLTRPAPELDVGAPHRPTHIAVTKAAEAPPRLRGALQRLGLQRLGLQRRPAARETAPARLQTVSTAPVEAPPPPAPATAAAPKPPAPRFVPPPAPDPDAPIATRPPYS